MSILLYKGKVEFDAFVVERSEDDVENIDESWNVQPIDQKKYYGASGYICEDCIKRFNLFEETETNEDLTIEEDELFPFTCCVNGCFNTNAIEIFLKVNCIEMI